MDRQGETVMEEESRGSPLPREQSRGSPLTSSVRPDRKNVLSPAGLVCLGNSGPLRTADHGRLPLLERQTPIVEAPLLRYKCASIL